MTRNNTVRNPLLKYSTEALLNQANPKGKYFFKKTTLNKFLYLLYLRLKERDIDIRLPYSWYKYGTFAEEQSYTFEIGLPFSHYFKNNGYTRAMNHVPHTNISDYVKSVIDEEIAELLRKYQDISGIFIKNYLQSLLDDVYATAPYDFQRTFNRGLYSYIDKFKTPKRKKIPSKLKLHDDEVLQINDYLAELVDEFPTDFSESLDLFLEWENTMHLALKHNHTIAIKLLEDYWDIFAKALRIKKNENVQQDIIDNWIKRYYEQDLENFNNVLSNHRNELLLIELEHSTPNPEVDAMVNDIMDFACEMSCKKQL